MSCQCATTVIIATCRSFNTVFRRSVLHTTSFCLAMPPASREEYGVGIVCALPKEMLAAKAMLDQGYEVLRTEVVSDSNTYVVGHAHGHKVVIACLPAGVYGTVAAATAATHMLRTFPNIRIGLMVGIGGGIPEPKDDGIIRLGDVVVSQPSDTHGGVVQHDQGKDVGKGHFILNGFLNRPPTAFLTALSTLKAAPSKTRESLQETISHMIQKANQQDDGYDFPGLDRDVLFCAKCDRSEWTFWDWIVWMLLFWLYPLWLCQTCQEQEIPRSPKHTGTEIHYGVIASGNVLLKNRIERDRLRIDFGAKCIEMEAAGLMNDFPCLVIRGICDYADSHKNDIWQKYAAIAAAAFAKLLLSAVSPVQVYEVQRATATMEKAQFYVPMRQTLKGFFGRKDELNKIATYFNQTRGEGRPQILVLYAIGGQGKSQIALEFCYSARDVYQGIFWINGTSILAMTQSLVEVAQKFDPSTSASLPDDEARIKFAIRTLEQWKHRWLMVFDNCDDASTFPELRDKFLPSVGSGSILFTSRHKGLGELGEMIKIVPMPHRAGIQLLLNRYRGIEIENYLIEGTKIVDRLGNLALAIDQASAYMQYIQLPIDKLHMFLPKYLAQREKVLRHTAQHFWRYTRISDSTERETAISAFTTWELSFQQLLHNEPNRDYVAHFLTLSAFFDQIPLHESLFRLHWERSEPSPAWMTMFTKPTSQLLGREDPKRPPGDTTAKLEARIDVSRSLSECQSNNARASWEVDYFWHLIFQAYQLSLVDCISQSEEVDQVTFTIHPLIRDWLQLRLASEERQAYTREAIGLLISSIQAYPTNGMKAQVKTAILLHIGAALISDREFFDEQYRLGQDISTCDDVHSLASFYSNQGHYGPSLNLFRTELATRNRLQGSEHPSTIESMHNVASVLIEQGHYSEAEEMSKYVVEVTKRRLGTKHVSTLNSMNNFAAILVGQGKYSEAEQIHRQVVELSAQVLGYEHPSTLNKMNNLAVIFIRQGKYSEAEQINQYVVEASRRVLGPEHMKTLLSMNTLAAAWIEQSRHSEAEQMIRQVVEVYERALGGEHPSTLTSINNLATVLSNQGKYGEAEQISRQLVEVLERVLGPEHPSTLICTDTFGSVLKAQGKSGEAERLYQRIIQSMEQVLGSEHPSTLSSMNNYAAVLEDLSNYPKAEETLQHVVGVQKRVLGSEHPSTLISMSNLASMLTLQGEHGAAATIQLEVVKTSFTIKHPNIKVFLISLWGIWQRQGQEESQIESRMQELLGEIDQQLFGSEMVDSHGMIKMRQPD